MAKKNAFGDFDPKELRAFIKELDRAKKSSDEWKAVLDGISTTFFGFSASAIFKEVPKSVRQITEEAQLVREAMIEVQKAGIDLQSAFVNNKITDSLGNVRTASEVLGSSLRGAMVDGTKAMNAILSKMEDYSKDSAGMWNNLSLEEQAIMAKKLTGEGFEFLDAVESIQERYDIIRVLLSGQEGAISKLNKGLLSQVALHESLEGIMGREVEALTKAVSKQKEAIANSETITKDPNGLEMLENSIELLGKNFGQKLLTNLNEVDKGIHEIQRSTGIMMAENTKGLSRWMYGMSEFGMSIKDVGDMMTGLGEELRTTDKTLLMGAVDRFKSLSLALGISSEEISKIGGEMMRAGESADDVADAFAFANKSAKMLGINSKTLVKQLSGNIEKMRQFGFEGGIKSLTKMAAKAESLRIQVDEIFDVAKRARTIEGAMEMASQLQLAGGSFSNINPMELLSAARKGPEELGKILTTMGRDIGHWSDDMKTYEFNPIDVDRLQLVADSTGMSLDSLQKIIQKNAETARKTDMFPDSMFSGIEDMDAELAKSTLGDYLEMSKDGKEIVLSTDGAKADLLEKAGIKSYADINKTTLDAFYKLKEAEGKRLEEQAKQNRGLSDTFNAFSNSLANLFVVFEPLLNGATQIITSLSDGLKWSIDQLNDAFDGLGDWLIPSIGIALVAFKTGIFGTLKGALSKFGGLLFGKKEATQSGGIAGLAGSIRQASDISKGISMGSVLKFAGALGIIGASVIGFMAGLNVIGGTPGLSQLGAAAASMGILGLGILGLSKIAKGVDAGGVLKMSIAMGIMGAAMIPFAYAMNMMKEVGWGKMLSTIGVMAVSIAALMGIGALLMGPQAIALGAGVAALIGIGAGMAVAGAGLYAAGSAFEKLASIQWDGIERMGKAMLKVAPAMLLFSASAMVLANPISLIGIGMMMGTLLGLSLIMVPLSDAMMNTSDSMSNFASSIKALKSGVRGVDLAGIFDGVATSLSKMNDVLEDSNMDRITQALSSIRVDIDSSGIDGLREKLLNMPQLKLLVDDSSIQNVLLRVSSIKMGLNTDDIERRIDSISRVKLSIDDSEISKTLGVPQTIKMILDEASIVKMSESMPELRMKIDVNEIRKEMDSLPSIDVSTNVEKISEQISSIQDIKLSFDIGGLRKSIDEIGVVKMVAEFDDIKNVPTLKADVDLNDVVDKISSISVIKMDIDLKNIVATLDSVSKEPLSIELKLIGIDEMEQVITERRMISLGIDDSDIVTTLKDLKNIKLNVDTKEAMSDISILKNIEAVLSLSNIEDLRDSLKLEISIDEKGLEEQLDRLQNSSIVIDASQLQPMITQLSDMGIQLDVTSIVDQMNSLPKVNIGFEMTEVERMMNLLSSLRISVDTEALSRSISELKVSVDTAQLERSISELSNVNMQGIIGSLASIEAKVSKFNETPSSTIKVVADDLGSSSNKMQMEVMSRLADAVNDLVTSSDKNSQDRKLLVELMMDGRMVKSKILKDTSILS